MYDKEGTYYDESDSESDNGGPDFYDVYQRQRHDHYVALLEPILRGETSSVNGKCKENQIPDGIDANDFESNNENLSDV